MDIQEIYLPTIKKRRGGEYEFPVVCKLSLRRASS